MDQNLSKESLIKEIERLKKELKKKKKYGLVWEEKPEEVVEMCKTKLPVLKEVKNKEIITDKDKPVNLLIEGDNYHALSVLNYTHAKKVDVIYIDPPYNTGARDWKYNNNYVDINDAWRHSKWLSFMSHRLRLLKNLLSPNGVLICTIDHNEQEALGLLLKELFPSKEITCVTIIHNPSGIQGKNFSYNNEYAYFVYRGDQKVIAFEERTDEDADIRQFMNTAKGRSINYLRESGSNCFYPIFVKNLEIVGFGEVCDKSFHPKNSNVLRKDGVIELYPIDSEGVERKWVFSRQNVESIKDELSIKYNKKTKTISIIRTKKQINYKTVWSGEKFNAKTYGTQLLNNILGKEFPFPKSLYAVEECIKTVVHNKNKAIILDFFAGSGTTGHAVLELNKEDGGNRKFILCTNNEDNNGNGFKIAEDICYPRIKKVIEGYKNLKGEKVAGLGGNLKYFKTDFVVYDEPTDRNKIKLTAEATEMLCVKEGTFEEIGEPASAKASAGKLDQKFQIFKNANHYTGIIFDQAAIPVFKKAIKDNKGKFSVYVFSLGDEDFSEEFADLNKKRSEAKSRTELDSGARIQLSPIPEAILRVYRRIFK